MLDPAKAWPPDRFIIADGLGVRLDLSTVVLDADLLLRDAAHAAALLEAGDVERAREVLTHVDLLHRGEAFEDEAEANAADPVLNLIEWERRRATLIAPRSERDGKPVYRFDIRLQGEDETVFFDI